MKPIEYFKQQAKNLLNDYKAKVPNKDVSNDPFAFAYNELKIPDASLPGNIDKKSLEYQYSPKYFDIEKIFLNYNVDENSFSLMKAQHLIARMAGFEKWDCLLKVSDNDLKNAQTTFGTEPFIKKVKNKVSKYIKYFQDQALNLLIDFKTKFPIYDEEGKFDGYDYEDEYFAVSLLIADYDLDADKFDMSAAKDVIADLSGFDRWENLLKASDLELEFGKLLFDNNVHPEAYESDQLVLGADSICPKSRLERLKYIISTGCYMQVDIRVDQKHQYQDLPTVTRNTLGFL